MLKLVPLVKKYFLKAKNLNIDSITKSYYLPNISGLFNPGEVKQGDASPRIIELAFQLYFPTQKRPFHVLIFIIKE